MTTSKTKSSNVYKIKLVIAGFIALGLSTGILINSVGQFILPIHNDMGYSVGAVSLAFSIICAGVIFAATTVAKFIDKYSPRLCMGVCTGILAVFTLLISFTTEIWQFYICTVIVGLAFTGLHTLPVSVMINNAFSEKRKGLATSIAFSGSGVGGMVFNPLFNYVVENFGWRIGFMVIAGIYFVGGIIIVCLVNAPKERIDEAEYLEIEVSEGYSDSQSVSVDACDLNYKDALKTATFKRLVIGMMITSGTGTTTMMHSVPYMININISSSQASFFISIFLLDLAVSKIILGFICDKLGVKKGVTIGLICYILAEIVMLSLQISPMFYILFLLAGGIGISTATVTTPLMTSHLFGNKDYTRIFGATVIFTGIGNSVFPFIMGLIFDITGSYVTGWIILSCLLTLTLILYRKNFKNPPKKRKI